MFRTKIFFAAIVVLIMMIVSAPAAKAMGEMDVLLEKLVEKGVITPMEARIIQDETVAYMAKDRADSQSYSLPSWVENMKLKGDFRLRYQYERKGKEIQSRSRGRVRYRLGIESKITENVKVGAGLASGSDDPRSTNQTFDNSFDTPDIRLDYAYGQYSPIPGIDIIGGKFPRTSFLWSPTDMLWDGDINPEGGSVHAEKYVVKNTKGFINTGVWILEELESGNTSIVQDGSENNPDPFVNYVQGGIKYKQEEKETGAMDATLAAIYYGFHGVQGVDFPFSKDTNTKEGGTYLTYDYDSFGFSGEFGIGDPFELPLERVAIFGDYINNIDPNTENIGWAAGIKFGAKKVGKKGQWQGKYQYAWLEKDAILDIFPDSDRLGGGTNVKGHEAIFEYGLMNNVVLGLDYYYSDNIKGRSATTDEHLIQSDIVLKF
jgi:hypothetical protein